MDLIKKNNMENNRLLASAALFRSMYSEELDQYDVLGEFIKAIVTLKNLYTFDVPTCTALLKEDFGFAIPDAVVRNCIRSKLKQQFQRILGTPRWERVDGFCPDPQLEQRFAEAQQAHEGLKFKLIEHVQNRSQHIFSEADKSELIDDFYAHLKGSPRQNHNFPYIGHFILSIETDLPEKKILEHTKQGLIIFDGLRFSVDIKGANLVSDLTIYIDTEVLFSAAGFHGELRQQLFNDFLSLVTELNQKAKKNSGKIVLRYFDDINREIENFFYAAESIANKKMRPEPDRLAMCHIVNGCSDGTDVLKKKIRFFDLLNQFKIWKDEDRNYYDPPTYNIETQEMVDALAKELDCEVGKASQVLKQFSRINFLRIGKSQTSLEAVRFILMSDKNVTRSAAFSKTIIDVNGRGIPFATDLDYMTERLWFKLNKGFSSGALIPTTFDVIARTRIVLSAQLGSKVAHEYQQLIEGQKTSSKMTPEMLNYFVVELMSKVTKPEDVTEETLDLEFLACDDFVANAVAEHSMLTMAAQEGREVQQKYDQLQKNSIIERDEFQSKIAALQFSQDEIKRLQKLSDARYRRRESNKPYVLRAAYFFSALKLMYWIIPISLFCAIIYFLKSDTDSQLAVFGTYFTVIPVIITALLWVFKGKFSRLVNRMKRVYLGSRLVLIEGRHHCQLVASQHGQAGADFPYIERVPD